MIIEWTSGNDYQFKRYYTGLGFHVGNWAVSFSLVAVPFGASSEIIESGRYFSEIIESGQYLGEIIEVGKS